MVVQTALGAAGAEVLRTIAVVMIAAENRMEGTVVLTASTQRPISCDRKDRSTTHVQGEGASILKNTE